MTKYVYMFSEGDATMRDLLGGKGANLSEMVRLGLPVPGGFVVTTEACNRYYSDGKTIAPEIKEQIFDSLKQLEALTGKGFGDVENPLLVSVRSGARVSMPGMMDTVLNLGFNDRVAEGMIRLTGNSKFVYDSYRRFIMMFSDVVMGIPATLFDAELQRVKREKGVENDMDLTADDFKDLVALFKAIYKEKLNDTFPEDVHDQLLAAVEAVFRSWNNERAIYYRKINNIPGRWGTAVSVVEMVYGNMGDTSGTGVAFTRNPATGDNHMFGEYLINAQGEDVVAGIRTPSPISHLKDQMPAVFEQFVSIGKQLERHYGDMQDIEFTIENGKLFILQTRNGKRTATAALQVAVDMVAEGLISREEALLRIDPSQLDALLHPTFDEEELKKGKQIAKGLPASPGAATGHIAFTTEQVEQMKADGREVIFVREEASQEDIQGMNIADGTLTARGGMTSHAAVVARGMGKCCVSGCAELVIDEKAGTLTVGDKVYTSDDYLSINGSTGFVYEGRVKMRPAEMSGNFKTIMSWADEFSELAVKTNADKPQDAQVARNLGAVGIGLTRTEHMFFEPDRLFAFRQMIVSRDEKTRREVLARIQPMQEGDFLGIFRVMDGFPVTIRLLDPPLHEFLPKKDSEIAELAEVLHMAPSDLKTVVENLQEVNPMLGNRGCRLAINYPEIAEMQVRAIIGAALQAVREGVVVKPEIMIPLVSHARELAILRETCEKVADQMIAESGLELKYLIGTMIEIPRACVTADQVAKHADFFSFGTNDLTQMTFGLSRDDAGKILELYAQKGIFDADPTAHIDREGVGDLMRIAVERGREGNPDLILGICGEHGGDPSSVEFCQMLGLDYVSCSPYRVPIARLAAAQAAIRYPRKK